MRYALFLGCTVPARGRNYELSTRKVAECLDIELVDIEEFSCCGFPIKPIKWDAFLLMAARNLCLAEERDLDICCLCTACTESLTEINRELQNHRELREEVNARLRELGHEFKGKVKVKHFSRILHEEIGPQGIKDRVKRKLSGIRFAAHYGCHYLKPSKIYDRFDDPEYPHTLDELIEATGATSVSYDGKLKCCGGGILGIDEDVALSLSKLKLDHVRASRADALCVICAFCSVMYDDNQAKINKKFELDHRVPVLYYPQILGLALGFNPKELGLHMNIVKTEELLSRILS